MVQKVVYNTCYGGFGVHSDVGFWVRENEDALLEEYSESDVNEFVEATLPGEKYSEDSDSVKPDYREKISRLDLTRDNELLADIVSGETGYSGRTNSSHASLSVAKVPDGVDWTIDEHDGRETIEESSRTFR